MIALLRTLSARVFVIGIIVYGGAFAVLAQHYCGVDGFCAASMLEIGRLTEFSQSTPAWVDVAEARAPVVAIAAAVAPVAWAITLMCFSILIALEIVEVHYLKRLVRR